MQEHWPEIANSNEVLHNDLLEKKLGEEALCPDCARQKELLAVHGVLKIANSHAEMRPLLRESQSFIKEFTKCADVGIHLIYDDGSIPCQVSDGPGHEGLVQSFFEGYLSTGCLSTGCLSTGSERRTDVTDGASLKPFCTEGGSFYVNSTTKFFSCQPKEADGQTWHQWSTLGYESVALIPVRLKDRVIGAIYIADPNEDRVPPDMVVILEKVGAELATAIERVRAEEDLRHFKEELEARMHERTIELAAANEALRASEELFRLALDNLPDAFAIYDPDLKFKFASSRGVELCGKRAEELIGHTDEELFPPEVVNTFLPILKKAAITGRAQMGECTIPLPGGTISCTAAYIPLLDEEGKIKQILAVTHDITDRKKMETALKESEQRLADTINFLPDATFVIDREGKVLAWNHATEAMTGIRAGDILGKGNYEHAMPFYGMRRPILADLVLEQDESIGLYSNFERKDDVIFGETCVPNLRGKKRYLLGTAAPLYDSNGNIVGAIESIRDITDRKMAEDLMRIQRDLGIALSSADDLGQALELILGAAFEIEGIDGGGVYLVDEMTGGLDLVYYEGLSDEFIDGCIHYDANSPRALLTKEGNWLYLDYPEICASLDDLRKEGIRALAALPVQHKGRVIADLNLSSHTHDVIPFSARSALEAIAMQAGGVIARIKAEEKMRESSARFRELAELLPDIIYETDRGLKITYANRAAFEAFGYSREDISKGVFLHQVIDEEEIPRAMGALAAIASGQPSAPHRYKMKRKDGSRFFCDITSTSIRDANGDHIGLRGVVHDITERKMAEDELKAAHDQLLGIIEFLPDATFVIDKEKKVIAWNRAIEEMTGVPKEAIVGKGDYIYGMPFYGVHRPMLIDLIDLDDKETESKYQNIERIGNTICAEAYVPSLLNGSGAYVWATASRLYDSKGNLIGSIESIRDITDRKEAEKAHVENAQFLQRLIDTIPNPIFYKDTRGVYLGCNNAFGSFIGRKREEIIGKTVYDVNPEDLADKYHEMDSKLLKDQGVQVYESLVQHSDGSRQDVIFNKATYSSADGTVAGIVGVILDITERKRSEAMLQAAKEAAEAADRAKSEFLANMSHEIRTPMNAIIGLTSILLDGDLTPEKREYMETIRNSGDALLAIINDILDISKVEKGKIELEYQPFDLLDLVEESLDLIASKAMEKRLSLKYSIDRSVPGTIVSDINRIRQVLANLLSNAVKFTEAGTVSIYVDALKLENDLYEVHFEVNDTGIGIQKESTSKLFLPFSQVDMTTTRKYGGTGLGLAISKSLVELLGGKIWADSTPQVGSAFHFTIIARAYAGDCPAVSIDAADRACKSKRKDKGSGQKGSSQKGNGQKGNAQSSQNRNRDLRILLAEDAPVNQKMTMLMLKRLGYRADAVANGLEVLEALDRQNYDLILMDIQMPEMDGLEATRIVRQHWPLGPKIIAVTAYALEGDKEKCIDAGMDGYIAKPIKIDELKAALEEIEID